MSRATALPPLSRPQDAQSPATHSRRVPLHRRRAVPTLHSPTPGRTPDRRRRPLHPSQERAGCLSLWSAEAWEAKLDARIKLLEQKLQADSFGDDRIAQVQLLGRLLSTRHRPVEIRGRGRLLIPEGFRKFLSVDRDPPENEVLVVGAAVCVEIWKPAAWLAYLERRMPSFRRVFHRLSR